jgi:hypothetical protein
MADQEKLRDKLLSLQGLDIAGPSEAQVKQFRTLLTEEKHRVQRWQRWTVALVWLWAGVMLALCMLERLWERLNIPFVVASLVVTALMWSVWLPVLIRLSRRLGRSRRAIQRLRRLLPEYVPPRIQFGTWVVRCGARRYIHGVKLLGFAAILWALFALGGIGVYLLLTQRLTTAPMRFQTVMAFCMFIGIVVMALRTPLKDLTVTDHVNPWFWWPVPDLPAWRLPRRLLTGLGGGMALACVALAVFLLYQENTLHAKVMRGFEDAWSFHVQGYRFEQGQPVLGSEIWHLRGRGSRIRHYAGSVVLDLYDNGRDQWQHTEGSDVAILLHGQGSILPRELTETARYLKQCERHSEGDRIIGGDLCQLYQVTHERTRSMFWIDPWDRFRRYEEETLVNGQWQAEEEISIAYDVAVDPNWITPRFEPDIRVIEPGAMLKTRYRLNTALARQEVLGLHFAVHEVQRFRDNLIITCSVRPTEQSLRLIDAAGLERHAHSQMEYGNFNMGSWWRRLPNGNLESRHYHTIDLGRVVQDGTTYRWYATRPTQPWPGFENRLEVCGTLHARGALAEYRRQQDLETDKNLRPILTIDLPREDISLEGLSRDLHGIQREVTGLHLSANHRRTEIPEVTFRSELEQVLQELQPYQTLWDEVGSEIQIELVDAGGNPVIGAQVGTVLRLNEGTQAGSAVSDASGVVVLSGPDLFRGNDPRQLKASCSAVLPELGLAATRDLTWRDFGQRMRLVMGPACRVTAHFTAPGVSAQEPASLAVRSRVYLHESEGEFRGTHLLTRTHYSVIQRVRTHHSDDGSFAAWLPPGGYELSSDAYNREEGWSVEGHMLFTVSRNARTLDLGEIKLQPK